MVGSAIIVVVPWQVSWAPGSAWRRATVWWRSSLARIASMTMATSSSRKSVLSSTTLLRETSARSGRAVGGRRPARPTR